MSACFCYSLYQSSHITTTITISAIIISITSATFTATTMITTAATTNTTTIDTFTTAISRVLILMHTPYLALMKPSTTLSLKEISDSSNSETLSTLIHILKNDYANVPPCTKCTHLFPYVTCTDRTLFSFMYLHAPTHFVRTVQ